MSGQQRGLIQFWQELKRRKVVRVITIYAAVAFVILQLVEILAPSLRLPEWTMNFILVLLIVGFIITVIVSWIYDIHPEGGIVKTEPAHEVQGEEIPKSPNRWRIATYMSLVIIVVLITLNLVGRKDQVKVDTDLETSIAVLPFHNYSGDPSQEYMCDGLTDEIINHLYKIESFDKVVSLTSVLFYKETRKQIPEIADELRVNYILAGTYKKIGDMVRVTAQLIEPKNDRHIWQNEYDRPYKEILAIQTDIALKIADELKTVLSPAEIERIEDEPTENIEAYNLYSLGRYFWNQGGRDGYDKSIEYYKQALEIDPNYALAYSGIAATYTSYATSGHSPRRDVMPQARTAAKKALDIDNTLGEAHAELAWIQVFNDWDWTGGEKRFKRALELNPNDARAHDGYAWLLSFVGRHDEAIQESKRAHELDPLSKRIWESLVYKYFLARDYDKAIEECRNVLEVFPKTGGNNRIALALWHKGLHYEAIEECSKIGSENEMVGYIYGVAGKTEKALEILNYYLELSKKQFVWPASIAFIYIGLGEKDKAFEWLEKTYEQHEAFLDLLKVEPIYDGLRSDPRFQDLVERMNFPD